MNDRHIEIAEHLWLVLETMARDMGTDPRSLVNQAVFNWARRNGYPVMSMALAAMDTPAVREPPAPALRAEGPITEEPITEEPITEKPTTERPISEKPISDHRDPLPEVRDPKPPDRRPTLQFPPPQPSPDESTRAIDPDSPAGALLRPRDTVDDVSAARNAVAARIVAIDRALDDILPTPGRAHRARMTSGELDSMVAERSVAIDTSPTPVPRFILELNVEGSNDTVIVDSAPVIIGRARHCDLVIESPQVSREHAMITKVGASYILEDKGSSNGTFIGDEQVHRHELCDGDICRIGTAVITVSIRADG